MSEDLILSPMSLRLYPNFRLISSTDIDEESISESILLADILHNILNDEPFSIIESGKQYILRPRCNIGTFIAEGGYGTIYKIHTKGKGYIIKQQDKETSDKEFSILRMLSLEMKDTDRPFPAPIMKDVCTYDRSFGKASPKDLSELSSASDNEALGKIHSYIIIEEYIKSIDVGLIENYMYNEILRLVWNSLKLLRQYGFIYHGDLHYGNVLVSENTFDSTRLSKEEYNDLYYLDDIGREYKYDAFIIDFGLSKIYNKDLINISMEYNDAESQLNILSDILCYCLDFLNKIYQIRLMDIILMLLHSHNCTIDDVIESSINTFMIHDYSSTINLENKDFPSQFLRFCLESLRIYSIWIYYIINEVLEYDIPKLMSQFCLFIDQSISNLSNYDMDLSNPNGLDLSFILRNTSYESKININILNDIIDILFI